MPNKKLPSETFCALPWMHLSSRPNGHMRVCCTANASAVQDADSSKKVGGGEVGVLKNDDGKPANFNTTGLKDAWNNSYMRSVRLQMLKGEKPASCLKCYKEEDAGHASKRMWETEYWGNRFDLDELVRETQEDGSVPPKIRYIDLRMGSKCQLGCVMCSPHDSSGWVKDWKKMYPTLENAKLKNSMQWDQKGQVDGATYNWHMKNPKFWEELYEQIPHMYQLYFAGGESTVIEEHYTLLEEVVRRGYAHKIELRYNSNGVELPQRLFDLWDKFKRVRFHYSIDAHGIQNDYIRYPSVWEHQVKQFHLLDNTGPNVEVTTATTIMALNIYYLPEFVKWKIAQNFKKINIWPLGAGGINMHFAYWPPQLNVKVLPPEFKAEVTRKYKEEFIPWMKANWQLFTGVEQAGVDYDTWLASTYGVKRFENIVNFMNAEDWSERLPEMKEWVEKLEQHRGQNFAQAFPDMTHIFDSIK